MRSLRFFPLLAIALMLPTRMSAEEPFQFETTPGKLPKQIVPTDYAIRIVPNIGNRTFTGTETVKLDVRAPVHEIVLNALEIGVVSVAIDDKALRKSAAKIDKQNELLKIALPSELSAGQHTLALAFPERLTSKARDSFTRPTKNKVPEQRRSSSERNSKQPMRAGCFHVGTSRRFGRGFN